MIPGRRLAGLLALATTLCGCSVSAAAPSSTPPPAMQLGVLAASCTPERAAAEARAGVRLAVMDVPWSTYEPAPGRFDASVAAAVRQKVETCEAAGLRVVLGTGMQYPPGWVVALPGGSYRDQHGASPTPPVANLVFSAAVRDAAAGYLTRLDADLGLTRFAAVRIGTSETGELAYPPPSAGGGASSFWAYDDAAQTGSGIAAGTPPSPLPGWTPGPAAAGVTGSVERATAWFTWYHAALGSTLAWQVELLRRLGYDGDVHVPVAGQGTLPDALTTAVGRGLDPATVANGALERGLYYPEQFRALADLAAAYRADGGQGRIVVDVTGLDDISAVAARRATPPQDTCTDTDVDAVDSGDPAVRTWSNLRWTVAVARHAGLDVVGENPGPAGWSSTGGTADSDDEPAQMQQAQRYAADCHLSAFFWAFEDTLFAGTPGAGPDDLGRAADRARSGRGP